MTSVRDRESQVVGVAEARELRSAVFFVADGYEQCRVAKTRSYVVDR